MNRNAGSSSTTVLYRYAILNNTHITNKLLTDANSTGPQSDRCCISIFLPVHLSSGCRPSLLQRSQTARGLGTGYTPGRWSCPFPAASCRSWVGAAHRNLPGFCGHPACWILNRYRRGVPGRIRHHRSWRVFCKIDLQLFKEFFQCYHLQSGGDSTSICSKSQVARFTKSLWNVHRSSTTSWKILCLRLLE